MLKPLSHYLDPFFLLRPTLFYPVWTFYLAGIWGGKTYGQLTAGSLYSMFLQVMLFLTVVMGSVYILNQTQDIETDRANGKLFLIANGAVSLKGAYIQAVVMAILGLSLGFFLFFRIGLGLTVLFIITGIFYNYPPFRWKNRPWMGLITNGVGGTVIYSLGWMATGSEGWVPLRVLAYALAGMAVTLYTTLPDMKGDAKTGKVTFGVKYGIRATAVLALILNVGIVILAYLFKDWLLFFPAAVVLPLFGIAGIQRNIPSVMRATKFSVLALASAICVVFPWYLGLIVFVFFLTRWYYRNRFQFDYPNFKGS